MIYSDVESISNGAGLYTLEAAVVYVEPVSLDLHYNAGPHRGGSTTVSLLPGGAGHVVQDS